MRTITPIFPQSDPWTPPKDTEFQAIKSHYVSEDSELHKALVNPVELDAGRSGDESTKHVLYIQ